MQTVFVCVVLGGKGHQFLCYPPRSVLCRANYNKISELSTECAHVFPLSVAVINPGPAGVPSFDAFRIFTRLSEKTSLTPSFHAAAFFKNSNNAF